MTPLAFTALIIYFNILKEKNKAPEKGVGQECPKILLLSGASPGGPLPLGTTPVLKSTHFQVAARAHPPLFLVDVAGVKHRLMAPLPGADANDLFHGIDKD